MIVCPISKHLKLDFSMSHSDERSRSEEISPVVIAVADMKNLNDNNRAGGEISSERDRSSLCDIEKSSFKCFEIGLKLILPTQVHTQRITKTLLVHLPDL